MPVIANNKNKQTLPSTVFNFLLSTALVLSLSGSTAYAQTVNQLLDSTYGYGTSKAIELVFNSTSPHYVDRDITGGEFNTCKLTALDGLYCLDGSVVRNWPNPEKLVPVDPNEPEGAKYVPSFIAFDCSQPELGLDTRKGGCTGMTVDRDNNIWLAGKNKGKTHSLIKLVKSDTQSCADVGSGVTTLSTVPLEKNGEIVYADRWCAYEYATGRPLIVDLTPVEGAALKDFSLPGHETPVQALIGLEERKTAVAFLVHADEVVEVVEVVNDKKVWGLSGPEGLMGISLLQLQDDAGAAPARNIFLVATSFGRILAYDAADSAPAREVFNLVTERNGAAAPTDCSFAEATFSVRASNRSNTVFVTDSEYCEVLALTPGTDNSGLLKLFNLSNDDGGNRNVSTVGAVAPTGVTVAPGNVVDLSGCGDTPCPIAQDEFGAPTATLSGVQLVDESISGLTLFQVDGMLDCRYVPHTCLDLLGVDSTGMTTVEAAEALIGAPLNVIVPLRPGAGDRLNPAAQRLNVTPMMPTEITDLFPGGMPDLLLPRYIRAQAFNDFRFGGFFGRTEDGVVFRDVFEGEFDIAPLAGNALGCSENQGTLLWDVLASVSERYVAADDTYAASKPQYLGTITNSGCRNPVRMSAGDWSFKPFGLEPTPCTYNPDESSTLWKGQGSCDVRHPVSGGSDVPDDAVYAKMLLVLIDELGRTVDQLACDDRYGENGGTAPLGASDCAFVQDKVSNAADKFYKCWEAAKQPKQSSGDQNCQAFESQLANLENELGQITPAGTDVANRVGKLKARVIRMRHILATRFAPSVPADGFDDSVE